MINTAVQQQKGARANYGSLAVLAGFSFLYALLTITLAVVRPLWSDELFTFYIARLAPADLVASLRDATDTLPPFYPLLTRASMALIGTNELGARAPAILGFWVFCLCLFRFVRVRTHWTFGVLAMLFPCVTRAHEYGFEARPYGWMLGCAGVALICYQSAVEGRARRWALLGLGVSLTLAVASHYYAVFLWAPFAVAELIRFLRNRRADWGVALAIGTSVIPLIVFFPFLLASSRVYQANFWATPRYSDLINTYRNLLGHAAWPLVGVLAWTAIYKGRRSPGAGRARSEEIAIIATLCVLPLLTVLAAKMFLGVYTARYALPVIGGIALAFAFTSARRTLSDPWFALPAAAILAVAFPASVAWSVISESREAGHFTLKPARHLAALDLMARARSSDLPVVSASQHLFLEMSHYSAGPLVYLADRFLASRFTNADSADINLSKLRRWAPIQVEPAEQYLDSHDRFQLLDDASFTPAWLIRKLLEDGWKLELKARSGDLALFECSWTGITGEAGTAVR